MASPNRGERSPSYEESGSYQRESAPSPFSGSDRHERSIAPANDYPQSKGTRTERRSSSPATRPRSSPEQRATSSRVPEHPSTPVKRQSESPAGVGPTNPSNVSSIDEETRRDEGDNSHHGTPVRLESSPVRSPVTRPHGHPRNPEEKSDGHRDVQQTELEDTPSPKLQDVPEFVGDDTTEGRLSAEDIVHGQVTERTAVAQTEIEPSRQFSSLFTAISLGQAELLSTSYRGADAGHDAASNNHTSDD